MSLSSPSGAVEERIRLGTLGSPPFEMIKKKLVVQLSLSLQYGEKKPDFVFFVKEFFYKILFIAIHQKITTSLKDVLFIIFFIIL